MVLPTKIIVLPEYKKKGEIYPYLNNSTLLDLLFPIVYFCG